MIQSGGVCLQTGSQTGCHIGQGMYHGNSQADGLLQATTQMAHQLERTYALAQLVTAGVDMGTVGQ